MRDIRLAIDGLGTIGREIASLLLARHDYFSSTYGVDVRLVAICEAGTGLSDESGLRTDQLGRLEAGKSGADFLLSSRPNLLIQTGSGDTGAGQPGPGYLRSALAAGCDVIAVSTSALIDDGCALRDLARTTGAILKISGAIGAALPTIDMLQHNLAGCKAVRIEGIFSPCANHLLDAMMNCGATFLEALGEAEKEAFADCRSRGDIDGSETARKLVLLANFGLDCPLLADNLTVQGVEAISEQAIAAWRSQAIVPRLVGTLVREAGSVRGTVAVRPYFPGDPMALVRGRCTAARIVTEEMGEIVVTNCAAEPRATAAAALKDLEHILRIRSGALPW